MISQEGYSEKHKVVNFQEVGIEKQTTVRLGTSDLLIFCKLSLHSVLSFNHHCLPPMDLRLNHPNALSASSIQAHGILVADTHLVCAAACLIRVRGECPGS
jgi:hypothetical protein